MSVELNHTIIPTKDKWVSAKFLADILSRQSRNQRGDSIVRRCQSCREPDDGVAHGAL
jgi:hypothetical protein